MRSWRAGALVFGSSAAVLVLEVLAGRLMAPYVGVSLETFTGIIGTVLAGIALGAAVGGALADQRDPRPLVGPALVIGGGLAWLSLPILRTLGPVVGSGPLAIVLLTAAAFLAPATVLSAVAPMVAKLRLGSLDDTGSVVGGLSAAGTFGALAGTFLTGFVLVAALPSQLVVLVVGAVLVAVGLVISIRWRSAVSTTSLGLLLVAGGAGAVLLPPPCDRETGYFCVRIVTDEDRPSGRSLVLDQTRHAYVDLEDPTHLELRYVRLFDDVVGALPPGPLDVLHLGGGGFTFPRQLAAVRDGSDQLVLEIDPELTEIARDELDLRTGPDLRVLDGDARLRVAELPTDAYDVVVGDAFGGTSVPWHLTTREVIGEIDRLLRPGGLYVMNVIDGGGNRFARAQVATLAERFEHLAVIVPEGGVPADRRVNQVLVASDAPLPDLAVDPADGEVLRGAAVGRFVDGAAPLTDDHAPVDQLLLRG